MTLGIRLMDSGHLTSDFKSLVFVVNLIDFEYLIRQNTDSGRS